MITQFSSLKKKKDIKIPRIKQIQHFECSPNSNSLGVTPKKEEHKKKIKQFFNFENQTPKPRRFMEINPSTEQKTDEMTSQGDNFTLLGDFEDNEFDAELERGLNDFITSELKSEFKTPRPVKARPIIKLGNTTESSARPSTSEYNQTPTSDSSNSEFSIGSLMEFKDEIIKTIKCSIKDDESETSSTLTDATEFYSVYENSDLRVRGIDIENLKDHKGKKFGIYDLFKARF